MQFRQKLGYMALGGLLVLGGHVLPGMVVPKATERSGLESVDFDTVTVRSLRVLDSAGRVRAMLEVTNRGSAKPVEDVMAVLNIVGVPVYRVGVTPDGGSVDVCGNDGEGRGAIEVMPDGGAVAVWGNNRKVRARMGVVPDGGSVHVNGNDGEMRVAMVVSPDGCAIGVFDNDEKLTGELP